MVQMGVLPPERQKEQEVKKPVPQDVVVVTLPTAPPAASGKSGCCSKRVTVCVAIVSILLALALAGTALGLYLRLRYYHGCIDWGCGDNYDYFGEDYILPSSSDYFWRASNGSSGRLIVEPFPYPEHGDPRGDRHGDHHGDHHVDRDGDHHGDRDGDHHGDRDGAHHGDRDGDHHGDRDGDHHGDRDGDHHGDGGPLVPPDPPRPVARR